MDRFSLIGAGSLGSHLAKALVRQGYEVDAILSGSMESARRLCAELSMGTPLGVMDVRLCVSELLLICVPDGAIAGVAGALAGLGGNWVGTTVLHTAGALGSDVLRPLAEKGAQTGSFHPMQTFPVAAGHDDSDDLFRGITIGIEGSPAAIAHMIRLSTALAAEPLEIAGEHKALYHAAAVMASNFNTALLHTAQSIWDGAVGGRVPFARAIKPLVLQSVANALRDGPEQALTGPFARGDADTIALHVKALRASAPDLIPVYCAMAVEAVHTARAGGHLTGERAVVLLDQIHTALKDR